MKAWLLVGMGLMGVGCGASDEKGLDDSGFDPAADEVEFVEVLPPNGDDGVQPTLVDRIVWGSERIDFIEIPDSENGSSIMVERTGHLSDGDIYDMLLETAPVALSPAEVWMSLSASRDVPKALAVDHLRRTTESGRTAQLYQVDVEQTLRDHVVVKDNAAQRAAVFFPAIPGHQWINTRTSAADITNGNPRYVCSEVSPASLSANFAGTGFLETSCNAATFNATGWIRVATHHGIDTPGVTQTSQTCFGPSNGVAWQCYAADVKTNNTYQINDWDTTTSKRISRTVDSVPTPGVGNAFYDGEGKVVAQ